jgi:hypothetical protein
MKKLLAIVGIGASLSWFLCSAAVAGPISWDASNYTGMVDASSSETIPVGTQITVSNWQQYKRFLPISFQAAMSGAYIFHATSDPVYTLTVGPTTNLTPYRKWIEDGEKYSGQVSLVPAPTGGLTMKGWVAGPPFPNPSGPHRGEEIMYNSWTPFRPFILFSVDNGFAVDRFGNKSQNDVTADFFQLSHLSEENEPTNLPYANGMFYVSRFEITAPEQSKYTTQLQSQPDDPMKHPETFVFLPSLRRSLRLSSAARCSPISGSDWVQDDNAWNPPFFNVDFLGEKKVLTLIMDPAKAFNGHAYVGIFDSTGGSLPGWPKAGGGHYELRTTDLIDLKWIPQLGSYCFSHRIYYVDRATWVPILLEEYDQENKFWKTGWNKYAPLKVHGQETLVLDGYCSSVNVDWQNAHTSISYTTGIPTIDDDVPAKYKDVSSLSQPGSLSRIMQ